MGTLFIGILLLMKAAQGYFNKKASVLLGSRHQFLSFSLFNYAVCAALSLLYLLAAPAGQAPGAGALAVSALGGPVSYTHLLLRRPGEIHMAAHREKGMDTKIQHRRGPLSS